MKSMTPSEFRQAFHNALDGIGNDFVNELVKVAPVDTSYLRNNINHEVVGNTVEIHAPEYALYLEFGTKPHEIRPVNAKALHWKSGKKDVFAMVVHHPGTQPQPFIRPLINTKLRDIIYKNLHRQLT
jgi:hypothetical protein